MEILRDSGILEILSITFRDMGIQGFLNFGDICHIYFRDMGYFPKYLKGYGILPPPLPGGGGRSKFMLDRVILNTCIFYLAWSYYSYVDMV